jgi:hypothetical protein
MYTLKSMLIQVRTIVHTMSVLSIVVFLSVGHYPYYGILDLVTIKASKYLCLVCEIMVSLFMFSL